MTRVRVKVELKGLGRNSVLDMLRYAGLLESNIKGFPNIIEYMSPAGGSEIPRWINFGAKAEIVTQQEPKPPTARRQRG